MKKWNELNAFGKLIRSRKFWLAIVDVVISTATYLVTWLLSPDLAERIIWLIAAWQPIIIMVVLGIAIEDAAEKRNIEPLNQ